MRLDEPTLLRFKLDQIASASPQPVAQELKHFFNGAIEVFGGNGALKAAVDRLGAFNMLIEFAQEPQPLIFQAQTTGHVHICADNETASRFGLNKGFISSGG